MNETESLETIDDQDFSEEIPKTEGSVIWHLMPTSHWNEFIKNYTSNIHS